MLVSVWNAMDAAITQLAAQEWMDSYTVAVVSSPNIDKESRDNILDIWRKLIAGSWQQTVKVVRGKSTDDQPKRFTPLREVVGIIKEAFGRQIRD